MSLLSADAKEIFPAYPVSRQREHLQVVQTLTLWPSLAGHLLRRMHDPQKDADYQLLLPTMHHVVDLCFGDQILKKHALMSFVLHPLWRCRKTSVFRQTNWRSVNIRRINEKYLTADKISSKSSREAIVTVLYS